MNANETSGQESDDCTGLEVTVCDNDAVNVRWPESERTHSVMLNVLGDIVHCSCKGRRFSGECGHADAIESRSLVVASSLTTATCHDPVNPDPTADIDAPRAVADGGRVESAENELPAIVDCDDDPHRSRCEGCGATVPKGLGDSGPAILHERGCPHTEDGR